MCIRVIRQLLYFADANVVKIIKSEQLAQFIARNVSTVIETSRRVGFSAKKVTEDQGGRYKNLMREMLTILQDLNYEVTVFVQCCECVHELDEAFVIPDEIEAFDHPLVAEMLDLALSTTVAVASNDKD